MYKKDDQEEANPNRIDLTYLNKQKKKSSLRFLPNFFSKKPSGSGRDHLGRFSDGSNGLRFSERFNFGKALPFIVAISLAGVYIVFRSFAASPDMGKKLVVMTYNLRYGGQKLNYDSKKIAALMAVASPDVVFVQETYSGQVGKIAAALSQAQHRKMYYAFAGTRGQFDKEKNSPESGVPFDGRFGHAIFSRYPFIDHRIISLPATKAENRALLSARIKINGKQWRLLGTHLINNSDHALGDEDTDKMPSDYTRADHLPGKGPRDWIREREAEYIRDYINKVGGDDPLILAGDFNTESSSAVFQDYLNHRILYDSDGRNTTIMKAGKPTKLYDHILYRKMPGAVKSVTNYVPTKKPYTSASDHLPSVTTFEFY